MSKTKNVGGWPDAENRFDSDGPTEEARRIIQQHTAYSIAKASGVSLTTVQRFQQHGTITSMDNVDRMLAVCGATIVLGKQRAERQAKSGRKSK